MVFQSRVLILTFYSRIGRGLVWNRVLNFTFHSGVGHGHGRSGIGCAFITFRSGIGYRK